MIIQLSSLFPRQRTTYMPHRLTIKILNRVDGFWNFCKKKKLQFNELIGKKKSIQRYCGSVQWGKNDSTHNRSKTNQLDYYIHEVKNLIEL